MTYVWLSLSTCHLQVYPSRRQMLFSLRINNVPKDVFLTTTLGRRAVLHSSQLYAEKPDQLSSMEAFLGLSKQNPTYICQLFFEPTQGCHKTVNALNRLRTPWFVSAVLCQHRKAQWSLLFGTPIFVSYVNYLDGQPGKGTDEKWSPIA